MGRGGGGGGGLHSAVEGMEGYTRNDFRILMVLYMGSSYSGLGSGSRSYIRSFMVFLDLFLFLFT